MSSALTAEVFHYRTGYFNWNPFVNADIRADERVVAPSVVRAAL
jgi:hypothetical protein